MGFWTGFFSVFNLFPETKSKTYDEIREDIDEEAYFLNDHVSAEVIDQLENIAKNCIKQLKE